MHTSIRKEIRTDQAMLIFSKPMQSRKQNEKLVRPIDFSTDAVPAKVDPRKALSQLSDEDLLKAMEERGLAKPKRAKKEATAETEAPETETPETTETPEL
jgi:imidazolonepropionase-like amidohydrolase